jgi:hypothetical protein
MRRMTTDSLFLTGDGVEDGVALGHVTRVDPEIGELPHVGVAHDLEGKGGLNGSESSFLRSI